MPFPYKKDTHVIEAPEPTEPAGLRGLRITGAIFALCVMILSVLGIAAFGLTLVTCFIDPSVLDKPLNRWEQLVRGKVDIYLTAQPNLAAAQGELPPNDDSARNLAGIFAIISRPIAIGIMGFIALILAHMLVSLYSFAATYLAEHTGNEASTLRKLIRELKNEKQE